MDQSEERSEIAFFDVETTVPTRPGQGFAILEFGTILVCPRKLEELQSYSTLIRPGDLNLISNLSVRCNGITPDSVSSAPSFSQIAPTVFDILHGRIWAGHNIVRFDCARIREAFAEIGMPAPVPKGTIDSLALLTQRFGRRAGDMKMASLANYFGLGQQTHRSLDDVRMNLEVLKYCATVLFLESSLPNIFTDKSWVSPNATTRSRSIVKSPPEGETNEISPATSTNAKNDSILFPTNERTGENHPILSLITHSSGEEVTDLDSSTSVGTDSFDMSPLRDEVNSESFQYDVHMDEKPEQESSKMSPAAAGSDGCSGSAGFLDPDQVSIPSIKASLVPLFPGIQRIQLLHEGVCLQLYCACLRVRFGLSTKFVDHAGRPRLSFVVDTFPSLCKVLDACNSVAQKLSVDSGSSSDWRAVVSRKPGYFSYPTARIHIPTAVNGDIAQYATEIYQKEASGTAQKLVFSKFDAAELDALFKPGISVDAFLSLDSYDYQQSAGIRLVAKKLIIHSE
ncbi:RNase_T domain-containing protein [Cephalotus follicularis]|uniref:RNase_T domain-containing protein n=1 Tax=Cephalotus follicularis TaxID=3775 RepID=A0A1Q3BUU7_CEPFO|nr:RNase_T domain-containing protein [Cephalotus follicularis]